MDPSLDHITVFLDRDGTLNQDSGYITTPNGLILFPGVVGAIARLNRSGSRVVLITNQSGIARGLMTVDDLHMIHEKLEHELQEGGGWLDGIFFCSHHPDDICQCRKPNPGLIKQATQKLGLDMSPSYFIGDKVSDMELANAVGSIAVLVMTSGYSQDAVHAMENNEVHVDFVALNFCEAADWIIQDAPTRKWG
jgi:heptosyltransferase-2